MKSLDALIMIFIFGLGVSFIVARGMWEARNHRLVKLQEARAKKRADKKAAL
jgi:hypothetical protein